LPVAQPEPPPWPAGNDCIQEWPERFFHEAPAEPRGDWSESDIIDALRATFDRSAIAGMLPRDLTELAEDAEPLDAARLDERMRAVLAAMQRIDWQVGRLLHVLIGARLYREVGFSTSAAYVRNRLGMCTRKARALVAIERKSWTVSLDIAQSYRLGELSWLRVLVMLPILNEDNAEAWLARARTVTLRRLRDDVEWALDQLDRDPLRFHLVPPSDAELAADRATSCFAEIETQIDVAADVSATTLVCGKDQVQIGADGCLVQAGVASQEDAAPALTALREALYVARKRREAIEDARLDLAGAEVTFLAPLSVVALLDEAILAFARGHETRWKSLARLLVHAQRQWRSLPKHRDPVFARDGWRCAVPACTSRRNLNDHHIIFRSHGGGNKRHNRITVCAAHHHHGIHAGIVRARGRAQGGITWELGVRPGHRPWQRFKDDFYLFPGECRMTAMVDPSQLEARGA
jgi:hypothetical protein